MFSDCFEGLPKAMGWVIHVDEDYFDGIAYGASVCVSAVCGRAAGTNIVEAWVTLGASDATCDFCSSCSFV